MAALVVGQMAWKQEPFSTAFIRTNKLFFPSRDGLVSTPTPMGEKHFARFHARVLCPPPYWGASHLLVVDIGNTDSLCRQCLSGTGDAPIQGNSSGLAGTGDT